MIAGDLKQQGHRERVEGFEEYMKTEPEMTVRFIESGYANLQMSEQKVRDLMTQYPQIRGIMATSAVTAMGLVDELKDTDIKIVAVDEQEDSLKAVGKEKSAHWRHSPVIRSVTRRSIISRSCGTGKN